MSRNRLYIQDCEAVAEELGLPFSEVCRAVRSFFDAIALDARRLPFNTPYRIYTKDKFEESVKVWNIPSIGRIGPVYSRYLAWRGNASAGNGQKERNALREELSQGEIEDIAAKVLSGIVPDIKKKTKKENYNRVWLVGTDGKRLARQVIPKQQTNV